MYKKFLNAILFGALILGSAGTITSCKDYDDEIDEINQKLNTMSSKDELTAQVASLTSAISAAQAGAAQAATEAANALAAAKEAAGVSDQALAAAAQAGGQSGEALTAAKNAAAAAETAAANTKKAADAAAAAAADAVKAAQAGAGSAAAADKASEAAGKAQAAAAEAGKTAEAAEKAAATAAEKAAVATEKAEAAANEAGVSAKEAAAAKTAAAAAEAKATEAAAQAAVAKQAEAAAQAAAADALKAAANAAEAAKKAGEAETLAKAADEASKKASEASAAANKLAGEAKEAAAAADKLANEAKTAANNAQGTANEAKATAEAAQALAQAAKDVAGKAATQDALNTLEETVKAIDARLKTIEDNVDSLDLAEIAKAVEDAKAQLQSLSVIASAVTSISLVDSYTAKDILADYAKGQYGQGTFASNYWEDVMWDSDGWYDGRAGENPLDLNFSTIIEQADYTFGKNWAWFYDEEANEEATKEWAAISWPSMGKDLKNAYKYKKGLQKNLEDHFVVRVSPTNAVIEPSMIQLVNSKGENLNEILEVVKVERIDENYDYLARPNGEYVDAKTRVDSETGLWIVTAKLKNYDEETFKALTEFLVPYGTSGQYNLAVTRATVNQDDPQAEEEEDEDTSLLVNKILYAVQVNNTEAAADRYVTSSYDLTLSWYEFQPANRLHFTVNGERVEKYNNRYTENSKSFFIDAINFNQRYDERAWLGNMVDVKPNIDLDSTSKGYNAEAASKFTETNAFSDIQVAYTNSEFGVENDNRDEGELLKVEQGQPITLSLAAYQGWAYARDKKEPTNVKVYPIETSKVAEYWYVVLDQPNSVESEPSEWVSWNGAEKDVDFTSYSYTGIAEVVPASEDITITVDCHGYAGDIIGFRVYAVNFDGTLIDPDGRAFYVQVGDGKIEDPVNTVIYPKGEDEFEMQEGEEGEDPKAPEIYSEFEDLTVKAKDVDSFIWTADVIHYFDRTSDGITGDDESDLNESMAFYPVFFDKDGKVVKAFTTELGTTDPVTGEIEETVDLTKVAQVATVPIIPDWLAYVDNKTYSGTLTLQKTLNGVKVTVKEIKITFTKKMPTEVPGLYAPKENQIVDGVYVAYLVPSNEDGSAESWAVESAEYGMRKMLDFLNLGMDKKDVTSLADHYTFTFEKAKISDDGKSLVDNVIGKTLDNPAGDTDPVVVVPAYFGKTQVIDGVTKHTTYVDYNFGKISTELYNAKDDVYEDFVINVDKFETIFADIYEDRDEIRVHNWSFVTLDQLKNEVLKEKNPATLVMTDWQNDVIADASKVKELPEDYITSVIYGEETFKLNQDYFFGQNDFDGIYSALLSNSYQNSLEVIDAELVTTRTGYEEYYQFKEVDTEGYLVFERKSNSTNPTEDVPSTLILTVKDSYGHDYHKINVTGFNVLRRK